MMAAFFGMLSPLFIRIVFRMSYCCIINCGSLQLRDDLSFFRIPGELHFKHKAKMNELSIKRRQMWIKMINREDLTETKLRYVRVCSKHFLTGKPAELLDVAHPDWAPNSSLGYGDNSPAKSQRALDEKLRLEHQHQANQKEALPTDTEKEGGMAAEAPVIEQSDAHTVESENDKCCQTEIDAETFSHMVLSLESTRAQEKILNSYKLTFESFRGDDHKTKYHTGVDTFDKFEILVDSIKNHIPIHFNVSLPVEEQIILTLMKLRLNSDFVGLAYTFHICPTTASTHFKNIVYVLHARLRDFLIWPSREILHETMPSCFKDAFGNKVSVIIDCFELFIEKPSDLMKAAQCWSHYKHHHTVKFLIGITPQGTVCFVSEAWGGRASDKHITINSKFLNNIMPGDLVLADRGFLISEYVRLLKADVKLPAFTKGKNQLHPKDIEETRSLARVRIHVERIIGTIRQKYRILSDNMPISLLSCGGGEPMLDKIVVICCALVNYCPSIVP